MIRGFNFEKQFNNILDSFNIDRYCKKYQKNKIRLSREAESSLLTYDFPGNIRELENAIQRAVTLAENDVITSQHLPASISQIHTPDGSTTRFSTLTEAKRHAAEQAECEFVCDCLQATKGHVRDAAKMAGIDASNFHKIMKKYEINFLDFKSTSSK